MSKFYKNTTKSSASAFVSPFAQKVETKKEEKKVTVTGFKIEKHDDGKIAVTFPDGLLRRERAKILGAGFSMEGTFWYFPSEASAQAFITAEKALMAESVSSATAENLQPYKFVTIVGNNLAIWGIFKAQKGAKASIAETLMQRIGAEYNYEARCWVLPSYNFMDSWEVLSLLSKFKSTQA